MTKKDIRVRSSIARTVEQDMVQGSVLHMGKHVTIVRNEIRSRKQVHGLGVDQKQEEEDPDSTLLNRVGAVTTGVQFQNQEWNWNLLRYLSH